MSTRVCQYCGESFSKSTKPAIHERRCFGLMELTLPDNTIAVLKSSYKHGEKGFLCQCSCNNGTCGEVFSTKPNLLRHIKEKGSSWKGEVKASIMVISS